MRMGMGNKRTMERHSVYRFVLAMIVAGLLLPLAGPIGGVSAAPWPPERGTADGNTEAPPAWHALIGGNKAERNPKLDATMARLAQEASLSARSALQTAGEMQVRTHQGRVLVQVTTDAAYLDAAKAAIEAAGGEVTGVRSDETLIQGWLPVDGLETASESDAVYLIRRPDEPVLLEPALAGNSTTEGLAVINGPAWHSAGYTGQGVKVGVIDGGFEDYLSLRGTDLPATVTAKNFVDGETDDDIDDNGDAYDDRHGTACAEIVHDIAPGAELYLAKIGTNIDLEEAVYWLEAQGVDIISTSLGWYNVTPGDGTGSLPDLVTYARNAGMLWVTAASNDRENHWGGSFSDGNGNGKHEFSGEEVNWFGTPGTPTSIGPGYLIRAYLRWDDWTTVDQDYDLYILAQYTSTIWIIGGSGNYQTGHPEWGQRPTEYAAAVTGPGNGYYGIGIVKFNSTRDVHFELFTPKMERLQYLVYDRSLANLADAPNAMTVAALDATSPYPQEPYSSQGPTNGPGGVAGGGILKPDIAGFANVATESYPGSTFNGTSSATPHVAGAAALVWGAYPGYSVTEVQNYLEAQAIDMGTAGQDTIYGHGRLSLGSAPANLTLAKRALNDPAPGEAVTFAIDVTNRGELAATNIVISDTIPADIQSPSWASSLGGLTRRGGTTYVWDLATLAGGASGVITVEGTVRSDISGDWSIVNVASISGDGDLLTTDNRGGAILGGERVYLPLTLRQS